MPGGRSVDPPGAGRGAERQVTLLQVARAATLGGKRFCARAARADALSDDTASGVRSLPASGRSRCYGRQETMPGGRKR